jgi:CheY-like chemotaxis protein
MKILIIEDNPDHLELIIDALHSISEVTIVTSSALTMADGMNLLTTELFDVCFCDLQLPDSNIEQTIKQLSSHSFSIPIIVLSSLNSLETAKKLLNKGVQDYIPKDEISPQLLYRTFRYAIERWNRQQEIETYNQFMQIFCSSLSHDFNGHIGRIITVVSTLKDSLEKRVDLNNTEQKCFKHITISTTKIIQLVNDLQQYLLVDYTHENLVPVKLNDVISKVSESLKRKRSF